MALEDGPDVDHRSDVHDRWWLVGPVVALLILGTLGALELLIALFNLGLSASFAVDGFPTDACPSGVTCSGDFSVLAVLLRNLMPLAILGAGWLLAFLALRGPNTVGRRPMRWAMSVAAASCPVVAYFVLLV